MPRPSLRPRVGLVGKFALASLIPILLLGVVLARVLRDEIRQRALANARESAGLLEDSLVQPRLSSALLTRGLAPRDIEAVDAALAPSVRGDKIARIKVWNRDDRVVYATDHGIVDHRFPPSDELEKAFGGATASEISDLKKAENASDRKFGQLLEVYTPLWFAGRAEPAGAFEVYLPYRPIAAAIAHDTRRLYLVLAGGLALLYLALFRIVVSASRRLRRQSNENAYLALHDPLTGLPNRTLFHDRAAQAIRTARREADRVGLMILDLDRFKEINDTLGHHNGDVLLKDIGGRLRSALRESDTVARLGGDEFGVLVPRLDDPETARHVAEKLRAALRGPLSLEGVTLDIGASLGIALFPDHGIDVESLLQRADVAMYVAKEDHSGSEIYSPTRDVYSPSRLALAAELRRAIDDGELVLHYQPKASLRSGRIAGVEALVRWQHPERGLIFPDEFVPLAERTGMIRDLTHEVVDAALRQLRAWRDRGLELSVSVNLSARDLLDVSLPERVSSLLERHGIGGDSLELEITESVILADPIRAQAVLARLDELGIRLAVDDYGSGYSSLGYLTRLPIREIKIDRSFVMNMERDENDAVIVRSTVDLGRNLGLDVVAEGVESRAVWDELAELDCDLCQGYFLSRPLDPQALEAWLRDRAVEPAAKV